jgi:hypothetical protein
MARVREIVATVNVSEAVGREMHRNVTAATLHLQAALRRKVGTPGPPRSRPGEPPHTDTTYLRNSLTAEVERIGSVIRGTVSTNAAYAPPLEYGTAKMAARPWARPTVAEERAAILAILRTGRSG